MWEWVRQINIKWERSGLGGNYIRGRFFKKYVRGSLILKKYDKEAGKLISLTVNERIDTQMISMRENFNTTLQVYFNLAMQQTSKSL